MEQLVLALPAKSAIEALILRHLGLATSIARRFGGYRPSIEMDLIQEAHLGVVWAVNSAHEKGKNDPATFTKYVTKVIVHFVRKYYYEDRVVKKSMRSHERDHGAKKIVIIDYNEERAAKAQELTLEFKELLNLSMNDDVDRTIIVLRSMRYNDTEIAEMSGMHRVTVTKRRSKVKERFENLVKV